MKKIKVLLLATILLTGAGLTLLTAKTDKPTLLERTTVDKYRKPGAPVDIEFTTQRVESGETCTVSIWLITSEQQGTMNVELKLDRALNLQGDFSTQQVITLDGSKKYPLEFNVIASTEGVYYIRLLVKMGNKGFRAFVVPVQIGNGTRKLSRKPLMKNKNGENISVSPAQEMIRKK